MTKKWTMPTDAEIEAQYAKAQEAWLEHYQALQTSGELAVEVIVEDTNAIKIRLLNDKVIEVPMSKTPELQGRTLEELQKGFISSHGMSLHWEDLDVDYSLQGLLE